MTYATIDGHAVTSLRVHVPARGVWYAEADLVEAPEVDGAVTIAIGALELQGTVDARRAGTHGLQRRLRIIGGGGGWGTLLAAKAYHNDSGIRALLAAQDAAREAGEQLGGFSPEVDRIGIDYVRQAGPAARALEDVIGSASWWVDYDGVTQVGARADSEADADPADYEVLEHDPQRRVITLAVDDLRTVGIGARLTSRLDEPQTVRELDVEVSAEAVRVRAWTGAEAGTRGRLVGAIAALVQRSSDRRLHGVYRYRVVQTSGSDRVELQVVRRAVGLPDVLPISLMPGVAGTHGELTAGAVVGVQFLEGDRTLPVVTHFAGRDRAGWRPVSLVLDATDVIVLGDSASAGFVALASMVKARLDSIQSTFDAHVHTTTATIGTGGVGAISVPTSTIGALDDVAASKVQAE